MPEPQQQKTAMQWWRGWKRPSILLIIVWVAVIALFAYAIIQNNKDEGPAELSTQDTVDPADNAATISPTATIDPNMTEAQREQARIRDSKRLADIRMLQAAISRYHEANEEYPENLEALMPDHLKELPLNPAPGGAMYVYTGIGSTPYSFYELSYHLEVGADGIAPGYHVASPSGIATP